MEFDNKTILIGGLIAVAGICAVLGYENAVLTIAGGLVGYLSKDSVTHNTLNEVVGDDDVQ